MVTKKKLEAYIYGAGSYAFSEFYRISESYNILGFVVTSTSSKTKKLMNVPVFSISDIKNKGAFFIICSSYIEEIKSTLLRNGFHNFATVQQLINAGFIFGEKIFLESKVIELKNDTIRKVIELNDIEQYTSIKDLVVSLTSFPGRFPNLELVIKSLKNQLWQPEKIILWVSYADYQHLPAEVINLQDSLFDILQCDDLKSYKKLIPALELFPNKVIVTADDDLYYWPTWLKKLIEKHRKKPTAIVAHRVHRINPDKINQYRDWEHSCNSAESQQLSPLNFPTGVAGILYPPNCFHNDVLNRELFLKLCPTGDDIWFYWMYRMKGHCAVGTGMKDSYISIDHYMVPNLYENNVFYGDNDRQLSNMINRYGFPGT